MKTLRFREAEADEVEREDVGPWPGRRTLTQNLVPRTRPEQAHAIAAGGLTGAPGPLPHLDRIQSAFGRHDVSGVPAFVGGPARDAAAALHARAYAADGQIAFGAEPDLFTAAHEAAHVVQQRGGVQLAGGVGSAGDMHERHADAVAHRVVRGDSAEALLDGVASAGPVAAAASAGVQLRALQLHDEDGDAGVPLPGGVATPDVPTLLASGEPITARLAEQVMEHYQGSAHDEWWGRYSGHVHAVLRAAAPAAVRAGGSHGAIANDWLHRLGPSPANATLASDLGQFEPILAWAESRALELAPEHRGTCVAALMTGAIAWTTFGAQLAVDEFQFAPNRQAWFDRWYPHQQVPALLRALPDTASPGGGGYQHLVRELLQMLQRREADTGAAEFGLTDHEGMVDAQADHLRAHPDAVVSENRAINGQPPTPMSAQQAAAINQRCNAHIPAFVQHMQQHHPEVGMTIARIRADALAVYNAGDAIAFAEQSTGIAVVGRYFADMVERDVAYCAGTIVHELYGHNEYGVYDQEGSEAGLDLYDEARSRPGMPAQLDHAAGVGSFGYIETEIYSLLRQGDYYTPNRPEDEVAGPGHPSMAGLNYSPRLGIESRLRAAQRLYEERVAAAQLRGLYRRLRADPHLQPRAQPPRPGVPADPLEPFREALRAVYPTRAAAILQ